MWWREQDQSSTDTKTTAKKPRFRVEKLEERIAPKYFYNPNAGKYVGNSGDNPPCNGGRYHAGQCK